MSTQGPFSQIRETSWRAILFILSIEIALSLVFLVRQGPIAIILAWVLVIGAGILGLGKLRPRDLGLRLSYVFPALLYLIVLWGLVQSVVAAVGLIAGVKPAFRSESIGPLVDQLLIFALAEEVMHRGFLFPQLCLKLRRHLGGSATGFVAALLLSQAFFALIHIPHRIVEGLPLAQYPSNLLLVMTWGIIYALVYWRSGNLLLAAGAHALSNAPTLLLGDGGLPWRAVLLLMALVSLALAEMWPRMVDSCRAI